MIKNLPRLALASSSLFLVVLYTGCAKHADFVNLRQELRTSVREQAEARTQVQEQQKELQRRLKALEVAKESSEIRQRLQGLAGQVHALEDRLAQFEETRQSPTRHAPEAGRPSDGFPSLAVPVEPVPAPDQESAVAGLTGISPTAAFNLAYNDYLSGRYDLSIVGFQRFLEDFPSTSLAPSAYYWLGESYYHKKDYVRAMQAFERLVTGQPEHKKVPAALFKIGLAAAETGDNPKAREYLKRVLEEYSTSNEAILAKNKLAELR